MSRRVPHPPKPAPDAVEVQQALAALGAAELQFVAPSGVTTLEGAEQVIRRTLAPLVVLRVLVSAPFRASAQSQATTGVIEGAVSDSPGGRCLDSSRPSDFLPSAG